MPTPDPIVADRDDRIRERSPGALVAQGRAIVVLGGFVAAGLPSVSWNIYDAPQATLDGLISRPAASDKDQVVLDALERWAEHLGAPILHTPFDTWAKASVEAEVDGVAVHVWARIEGTRPPEPGAA